MRDGVTKCGGGGDMSSRYSALYREAVVMIGENPETRESRVVYGYGNSHFL